MNKPDASSVSVVVPTIGRRDLLPSCLQSLGVAASYGAEVIVADQSGEAWVESLVRSQSSTNFRHVPVSGIGAGRARNAGALASSRQLLLFTDDDCEVAKDWIEAAATAVKVAGTTKLLHGKVLTHGDPMKVPSLHDKGNEPQETSVDWALWTNNFGIHRDAFDEAGGFDETFTGAAEDLDFAYRWLNAGKKIRYDPKMVVWHADWRTSQQLDETFKSYAAGLGRFYGRHLLRGDVAMARRIVKDLQLAFKPGLDLTMNPLQEAEVLARRRHLLPGVLSGITTGARKELTHRWSRP